MYEVAPLPGETSAYDRIPGPAPAYLGSVLPIRHNEARTTLTDALGSKE
jgi:hypothetical protein